MFLVSFYFLYDSANKMVPKLIHTLSAFYGLIFI